MFFCSNKTLGSLTVDATVLIDFIGIHFDNKGSSNPKKAWLVILLVDFTVLVFDARDDSVSAELVALPDKKKNMYGWLKVDDEETAHDLASRLRNFDKKISLPPISTIQSCGQHGLPLLAQGAGASLLASSHAGSSATASNQHHSVHLGAGSQSAAGGSMDVKPPSTPQRPSSGAYSFLPSTTTTVAAASPVASVGTFSPAAVASCDSAGLGVIDMSQFKFKYDESSTFERGMGMKVRVAGPFNHYSRPNSYARVFFDKPDGLYFLNAAYLRLPFDSMTERMFTRQGKPVPLYVSSLSDITICIRLDPHNYKRSTKSRWTQSIMFMVVEWPTHLGPMETFVSNAIATLASNYSDTS